MLKLASSRTLPFWWDDVSDFNTLEALTIQTFNQVNIRVVLSFVFCGNIKISYRRQASMFLKLQHLFYVLP